jgi:subtilase family serine protease
MTQGDTSKGGRRPAELNRRAADLGSVLCLPGGVDLVVTKIGMTPANPAPGQAVTFNATISNFGSTTKPVGAINGVGFRVDGNLVSWSDTNTQALAPGQSVTLTTNSGPSGSATWPATAGSHNVEAWVDDVNRIAERDENNNKLTIPFTTGIDLTITNISWSPALPQAGQQVLFTATIKNTGSVATPNGTILGVAFQINNSNVSWSDTSTASLAPGASRTLTANFGPLGAATWPAVSGTKRLAAWVDDVNRVVDVNRSNNKIDTQLVIP